MSISRSREGAWIEIVGVVFILKLAKSGRSREGAWIEMESLGVNSWLQSCRSREGAWIEINIIHDYHEDFVVAPARERGLKS